VPGQSFRAIGLEVLLTGLLVWVITLLLDIRMLRAAAAELRRHYRRNVIFTQFAMLPYLLAGVMILTSGQTGIYFLIPGIFISLVKALTDAWVLLVEIHR
jgi:modulator of FtsH protease